jgi:hypothetical protein
MSSLHDWYRYLDRISRPARDEDDPRPAGGWRPWNAAPEEGGDTSLSSLEAPLPDLGPLLAPAQPFRTCQPATREDPTTGDALPPLPQFPAPALRAPTFEVSAPPLRPDPAVQEAATLDAAPVEAPAAAEIDTSQTAGQPEPMPAVASEPMRAPKGPAAGDSVFVLPRRQPPCAGEPSPPSGRAPRRRR